MKPYLKKAVLHTGLLLVYCLLLAFFSLKGDYICAFIMLVVLAFDVVSVCRFLKRNAEEFENFIWSIRYSEFQTSYQTQSGQQIPIPEELKSKIEEALHIYKVNLQKKESSLQYFQALANHIDAAVLVYTPAGQVEWANQAMNRLSGHEVLTTLNDLADFCPELPGKLRVLQPGEVSVVQVLSGIEPEQLAFSVVEFVIQGRSLMVCSLKNIRSVLENKEIESWEKLIRVITHEIMNSITPIISLSELLARQLEESSGEVSQDEIRQAIRTIHSRSEGIFRFVETYRQVTRIPIPSLEFVDVASLLSDVTRLMVSDNARIQVIAAPEKLLIRADRGQIEQVLINLVKNGIEAAAPGVEPVVKLSAGVQPNGVTYIAVSDNGTGILPDVQEHIFVPFFTTKSKGSGIGLSISHQIMYRHRGYIQVDSLVDRGTTFTLRFPSVN